MLFRHPRSLVVVLLAIAALAAFTLDRLGDTAEHQREAVLMLTRLQVVSKSLEVVQERLEDPVADHAAARHEARALMARADALLSRLEAAGAAQPAVDVRHHLDVFRLGIENEFGLLERGRRTDAQALDEAVVEPTFESFDARLDELAGEWSARAGQVERTRRLSSSGALMLAAGLVAAAVLRFVNERERVGILEEHRDRLSHRATHDSLTGLVNRDRYRTLLTDALGAGRHPGVAFIDLDGFKEINDRFGHAAGDELLQAAAERIRSTIRTHDVAARLGGDEFAVLFPADSAAPGTGAAVAERIRSRLAEPFNVDGRTVTISASVGLAYYTGNDDAEALLRRADTAMYAAKHGGKGRLVVDGPEEWSAST